MGRQLDHSYPALLSDITSKPQVSRGLPRSSAVSYEIRNTMHVPIFWRDSQGVMVVEPPASLLAGNAVFSVTISYEINAGASIDTRELLREVGDPSKHVERKRIYEVLSRLEADTQHNFTKTFSYTVGISYDDLLRHGGVVYLNDIDLVVGFQEFAPTTNHPYSTRGKEERVGASLRVENGTQLQLLLVDNAGMEHTRWINTGQRVMELKAQRDASLNDGVYVTYIDGRTMRAETEFYPIDSAEKELGIYRSYAEALAYGAPDERNKQFIKELEHAAQIEKQEAARIKAQYERETLELKERVKAEEDRLSREKETRDREWQNTKDEMDRQRSRMQLEKDRFAHELEMSKFSRKDQSDGMKSALEIGKAIVGVISLCLSLYLALQKSK